MSASGFPNGCRLACALGAFGLICASARPVSAQWLPATPVTFGDGRATIGGDVSVTFSPKDTGYFNYTDYDRSTYRMFQVDLAGSVTANEHLAVLGTLRVQNAETPQTLALYARVRPWSGRNIEILAGIIPPTFGAFPRRAYSADNPLIGEPLAYQYLTSLRPDALPRSADELARMRGRGWLSNFSVGNTAPAHGLPLVSVSRWDTGVQLHAGNTFADAAVSMTIGSPANPLFSEDNDSRQIAARVALHPAAPLVVGVSAARGAFVSNAAARAASVDAGSLTERVIGADAEFSKEHLMIRFEAVLSDWTIPPLGAPEITAPLGSRAVSLEGRYKLRPGLYAAARFDHLGFSTIEPSTGPITWDAPVDRLEVGGGYLLQRNLVLKLAGQYNWRDGGRARRLGLVSAQLLFWL